MQSGISSQNHVFLRLNNGRLSIVELKPNTTISIPKYGAFSSNLLLGRPYYTTFEFNEVVEQGKKVTKLRHVRAAEMNAESLSQDVATPTESRDEKAEGEDGFDLVADDGQVLIRNNRLTIDDPSRQALTMNEIEELKKADSSSGKEIIAKIMAAHSALNEKTMFSLAKYTLRKSRKYIKRFTVLPMDVGQLTRFWTEKESSRIMDLREESLGLIMSWSNVHHGAKQVDEVAGEQVKVKTNRYLVVDDACGLVVASLADRLGVLYSSEADTPPEPSAITNGNGCEDVKMPDAPTVEIPSPEHIADALVDDTTVLKSKAGHRPKRLPQSVETSNTITVLHSNSQPNLALLDNFGYKVDKPSHTHPLYSHLRTLNWLQLLDPMSDDIYSNEPSYTAQELREMKPGKKSQYWFKRKRWEKVRTVVDETREGGFDSLILSTSMELPDLLSRLVPLVRGGGNIVIYSPNVEPLTEIMDLYSKDRRAGYVRMLNEQEETVDNQGDGSAERNPIEAAAETQPRVEEDFPVDPTLLLNPMLQTVRAREWQVLPKRTHPHMTSKGGCEGYIFTATRVLPIKGQKIEARGKFSKKRKGEGVDGVVKKAKDAGINAV